MDTHLLDVTGVNKTFKVGIQEVNVIKDVNFTVYDKDFIIIIGPSGSGKSTILHTILGLEPPTSGTVKYLGQDLYAGSTEDTRSDFRKKHIGMIYQQPNWIKSLSVLENVAFPLMLLGQETARAQEKALEFLKRVQMDQWASYIPTELSGGQQQRVAMARSLVTNPMVIIADEPTGNLDFTSGQKLMELFSELNKQEGKTIIMVTHDLEYLPFANRVVKIFDGQVEGVYTGEDIQALKNDVEFKLNKKPLDKKPPNGDEKQTA